MTLKSTNVSKLKATLSEYLTQVKAGEEVMITERGKPIAKIVPLPRHAEPLPPHLLNLARIGLVRLGSGKLPPGFWEMPRPKDRHGRALKVLLEEREADR
jgi:prevent-host-death family protein